MNTKCIQNEAEYQTALAEIDKLMDTAPGFEDENGLALLVELVVNYEEIHYPIELPNLETAGQFRLEQGDSKDSRILIIPDWTET